MLRLRNGKSDRFHPMIESGCETEDSRMLYVHIMTGTRGGANRAAAHALRQTLGSGDGATDGTSQLTPLRPQPLHPAIDLRVCLTNGRRCCKLCAHMSNVVLMGFHKHGQREEHPRKLYSGRNTVTVGTSSQRYSVSISPTSKRPTSQSQSSDQSKTWRVPRSSPSWA